MIGLQQLYISKKIFAISSYFYNVFDDSGKKNCQNPHFFALSYKLRRTVANIIVFSPDYRRTTIMGIPIHNTTQLYTDTDTIWVISFIFKAIYSFLPFKIEKKMKRAFHNCFLKV